MSTRRETMIELLDELGEALPTFGQSARLDESPAAVGARLRTALGLELATQRSIPQRVFLGNRPGKV